VTTISPTPATRRCGSGASNPASSRPKPTPGRVTGDSQASACAGPKFNSVDKVMPPMPSRQAPAAMATRASGGDDV